MTTEEHVAVIMNRADLASVPPQNLIQITAASPPQRLVSELHLCRSDLREIDMRAEAGQIILARIERDGFSRDFPFRPSSSARLKFGDAILNLFRHLGQGWRAIGGRKFHSVVLRRIVARG